METFATLQSKIDAAQREIHKRIIGNETLIRALFLCLFSSGVDTNPHLLVTGKTGVGKTTLAKTAATVFGFSSEVVESEELVRQAAKRIDGNGEPTPSDIIGSTSLLTGRFEEGPIFTNLLIVDEMTRLNPRTRAALLAPMAEGIVTVEGGVRQLPAPFVVIATQNPTSYGDSFPLRLQENDRFLISVFVDWPSLEDQVSIMEFNTRPELPRVERIFGAGEILAARKFIAQEVFISRSVREYAATLTRQLLPEESRIEDLGSRVDETSILRGGDDLVSVARTFAALRGEDNVTPDHVDRVARNVLAHRVSYWPGREPNAEGVRELMDSAVEAAHAATQSA